MLTLLLGAIAAAAPVPVAECREVQATWQVEGLPGGLRDSFERYRADWRAWCERGGSIAPLVQAAVHLEVDIGLALHHGEVRAPSPEDEQENALRIAAPLPGFRVQTEHRPAVAVNLPRFRELARLGTRQDRELLALWAELFTGTGWSWAGIPPESDHVGGCMLLGQVDLAASYERVRQLRKRAHLAYQELLDRYLAATTAALEAAAEGRFPGCRQNTRAAPDLDRLAQAARRWHPRIAGAARALAAKIRSGAADWADQG